MQSKWLGTRSFVLISRAREWWLDLVYHPIMLQVRRILQTEAALLRRMRLAALSDTPMAFGSTYARELAFDDAEWNKRAARLSSAPDAATFLAFEGEDCCGIIGGFLAMESATDVMVVSMWVAPHARRKGVAARLMQALESWARE